jgi:hypothetical protein
MESGISPDELWPSVCSNDNILTHAHVLSFLVYVFDAALQDGKKIPKQNPWAHLGHFLGFSDLVLSVLLSKRTKMKEWCFLCK